MIALRGQVDVDLTGKIIITPKTQQLRTSFNTIPDVAIKKFTLHLFAGKHGALGIVQDLCKPAARRQTTTVGYQANEQI
jgi:hypothetical protein